MADSTLEPGASTLPQSRSLLAGRAKFTIGGIILLAAVAYLIVTNITNQSEYYTTVDDLVGSDVSAYAGRDIRVIGAVDGDTIEYDGQTLAFTIVHIPDSAAELDEGGGLAEVLHAALANPDNNRLDVVLYDEPMPDLLQHEAQAIVTGTLGDDGIFYADELLLKCPTRYEEAVPDSAGG